MLAIPSVNGLCEHIVQVHVCSWSPMSCILHHVQITSAIYCHLALACKVDSYFVHRIERISWAQFSISFFKDGTSKKIPEEWDPSLREIWIYWMIPTHVWEIYLWMRIRKFQESLKKHIHFSNPHVRHSGELCEVTSGVNRYIFVAWYFLSTSEVHT